MHAGKLQSYVINTKTKCSLATLNLMMPLTCVPFGTYAYTFYVTIHGSGFWNSRARVKWEMVPLWISKMKFIREHPVPLIYVMTYNRHFL